MPAIKKQRLDVHGHHQVTASSDIISSLPQEQEGHKADIKSCQERTGRSLFVHSLPLSATAQTLEAFFSQSYPVRHATVVVDPTTKKSKGYGFVTFADGEDAQSAKTTLNQSLLDGQKIRVDLAEPRHRQAVDDESAHRTTYHSKSNRQIAEVQQPSKLIVRNLPWSVKDSDQLAALFRSYGKVKHATIPKKKPGLSPGFGFVVLRGRKNAEKALKSLNGQEIEGRTIAVDWAVEKNIWDNMQGMNEKSEVESQIIDGSTKGMPDETLGLHHLEGMPDAEPPENSIALSTSDDGDESITTRSPEKTDDEMSKGDLSTLFIRNLPFSCCNETLKDHFHRFGAVRYARVVVDPETQKSKGTGFVCFFQRSVADSCLREAPRSSSMAGPVNNGTNASSAKQSLLQDSSKDLSGRYTIDGRILQLSRALNRRQAEVLTYANKNLRDAQDKDKRRLYLLSEGTIPSNSLLHDTLSKTEIKMRNDSKRQRQSLLKSNPSLHLSLTRLSIRNIPRNITSKDLKGLAREAAVGFAKDVKSGLRHELSREELARGGEQSKEAEKLRREKGKGIVRQAKVIYESREGGKVSEESGAGRSRGYGFIEYSSHRWALMGLRWLNGHAVNPSQGTNERPNIQETKKRLIAEFSIENAQVVGRREEKETKARERSKFISDERENSNLTMKSSSKNQTVAKQTRQRRGMSSVNPIAHERKDVVPKQAKSGDEKKANKRQQIIGRKRMLRKQKKRPASH